VTSPLLAVHDLRVSFPTEAGPARAVDGVSFTVHAGETVALVGESGCGKTLTALSLLRLMPSGAHLAPSSRVEFDGADILSLPERALRSLRGDRIAMIFQEPMTALNPVLTVGDQVAEVVRVHTTARAREAWGRAVEMLALVGIPDAATRAHQYPHELSGGMRQRVMIAMALMLEPALVIADEPTTALDATVQLQILALLERGAAGRATLLITHDLGVAAGLCDRILVMHGGRCLEHGPTAQLLDAPSHPYTQRLLAAATSLDRPVPGAAMP
jgi:peptide/nickel transport system ATP-binding protein